MDIFDREEPWLAVLQVWKLFLGRKFELSMYFTILRNDFIWQYTFQSLFVALHFIQETCFARFAPLLEKFKLFALAQIAQIAGFAQIAHFALIAHFVQIARFAQIVRFPHIVGISRIAQIAHFAQIACSAVCTLITCNISRSSTEKHFQSCLGRNWSIFFQIYTQKAINKSENSNVVKSIE